MIFQTVISILRQCPPMGTTGTITSLCLHSFASGQTPGAKESHFGEELILPPLSTMAGLLGAKTLVFYL